MAHSVHEAVVAEVSPLARAVVKWTLRTDPPEPLAFRPGQFISLRVGEDAEGSAILRSYSIASAPGSPELDLVVKLLSGGVGSAWFEKLKPGDRVRFTGPMGFFVLDFAHPGDVVFAVTGVGIAPVLPMLEELLRRPESGRVQLYWGNRDEVDLFWQSELNALERAHPRFSTHYFLTGEGPTFTGRRGRITPAVLKDFRALHRPTFYLVGNGAMVREVRTGLVEAGVDRKHQIRNEVFYP